MPNSVLGLMLASAWMISFCKLGMFGVSISSSDFLSRSSAVFLRIVVASSSFFLLAGQRVEPVAHLAAVVAEDEEQHADRRPGRR